MKYHTAHITVLSKSSPPRSLRTWRSHLFAQPTVLLQRISTALRPAGTFVMWDVAASSHLEKNLDNLLGPFLYACSCMHCMTVSLAQNGRELAKIFSTVIKPSLTRGVHRFANSPSGECRKFRVIDPGT